MDLLDKAKELGKMIADSEEMKRLKDCDASLEGDVAGKLLLKEYKELQIEVVRASKEKKEIKIIDEIKERLLLKQKQLNDYTVTSNYLEAKSNFDKLMKNVNDVIVFAISGEEQCSPDKCSSCSGCK